MATIEELVQLGNLHEFEAKLGPRDFKERSLFVTNDYIEWHNSHAVNIRVGYGVELDIYEQVDHIFTEFVIGKKLVGQRVWLDPRYKGVYELKIHDIRIFGWFYRKGIFIASYGAAKIDLKGNRRNMKRCINRVERTRNNIDLDEPKYIRGDAVDVL